VPAPPAGAPTPLASVDFLASDDAAHVHGATISVDGGMTAVRGFV
jgi:NAD(P)-dependent dehydrogenase (short-subunit alcohol dehydrogenase family)